ncbi:hypothetical protein KIN20_022214 [Parelaphostrongylus tenuis]|uniref:Uncharacterized protein n=1 Tax=Parelaphostrongylus tenuis TaxID=148309 RepID=A0AAD5MTS3_PARTN|nr:hypothetical protein KIN20_022214 [Parelaphostrongylus tenuis]
MYHIPVEAPSMNYSHMTRKDSEQDLPLSLESQLEMDFCRQPDIENFRLAPVVISESGCIEINDDSLFTPLLLVE